MSESPKKQNFLQGAALLAMSKAIVKVIGALYKIPLKAIIGDQGFSYFNTAYALYSLLLMIATAGLPVAMSRMISKYSSLQQYGQLRRIFKTARALYLGLGTACTLLMILFCRELATFQGQPNAVYALLCLAPCALLMGIMSTYRGFYQGQGNMLPTSMSQVMEAFIKLFVGLGAAYIILQHTGSIPMAAGGAILGVTVSCLCSAIFLKAKFGKAYKQLPHTDEAVMTYGTAAKSLFAIAIPITIGSAGLQLLTVLETHLYMGQLLSSGMTQDAADVTKGIYDFSLTIFNLPTAFIAPITISVLPAVTAQLTLKTDTAVRSTEESAARVTGLLAAPCAVGLAVLAAPIMALLGGYEGDSLELASTLLTWLGAAVFLYSCIQYTNALLQSHGYAHVPVINMLLCGAVKLIVVYVLTGNPAIGITGAPIGAVLGYSAIVVLNLIAIRKLVPQKPALLTNILKPVLPAAIMGVAVYGVYWVLVNMAHVTGAVLLCGIPIVAGVAVYAVTAVLTRAITREDCLLLPKGEKIARFLKL